jgi:hypothetical protein
MAVRTISVNGIMFHCAESSTDLWPKNACEEFRLSIFCTRILTKSDFWTWTQERSIACCRAPRGLAHSGEIDVFDTRDAKEKEKLSWERSGASPVFWLRSLGEGRMARFFTTSVTLWRSIWKKNRASPAHRSLVETRGPCGMAQAPYHRREFRIDSRHRKRRIPVGRVPQVKRQLPGLEVVTQGDISTTRRKVRPRLAQRFSAG